MSGFDTIISQDQPIQTLKQFLKNETIPHAMLFTGIDGVGKRLTAITFAMAANCKGYQAHISTEKEITVPIGNGNIEQTTGIKTPCGKCDSCKKIRSMNHPDILFIAPSAAMIKIHQIREMLQTLALKPYEARVRVVCITNSHTMNPPAANALLKVLEEPPDRTVFILTAKETSDLLPTIVSRCRQIRFNPLSEEAISTLLMKNANIHHSETNVLSAMAAGSYTKALDMSRSNWLQKRKWLIKGGGLEEPENLSTRPTSFLLAFSERLAKNRPEIENSLDIVKSWLRDILVWKYNPDKIINKDLAHIISRASENNAVKDLLQKIAAVEQTENDIKANMNIRLCLDILMLRLAAA